MRRAVLALALGALGCDRPHVAVGALEIDPALSMDTQLDVLESRAVAQRVSRALGAAAELRLDDVVHARRRGGSRVIEIEARDPDLHRAAELCDAVMKAYLDRRVDQGHQGDARVVETCVALTRLACRG